MRVDLVVAEINAQAEGPAFSEEVRDLEAVIWRRFQRAAFPADSGKRLLPVRLGYPERRIHGVRRTEVTPDDPFCLRATRRQRGDQPNAANSLKTSGH